jgi:hypothetical protein
MSLLIFILFFCKLPTFLKLSQDRYFFEKFITLKDQSSEFYPKITVVSLLFHVLMPNFEPTKCYFYS